ncbi:hypothetical protein BC827DRAFT_1269211 [Russula dissimulans]|nr:hypothetical protein BC827DRAFT_1269211 [Russula dissimulans]
MAPSFLGLFSKRENQKAPQKPSDPYSRSRSKSPGRLLPTSAAKSIPSPSIADASDNMESSELSLEAEYVLADAEPSPVNSTNVYPYSSTPNGPNSSTTKLKMPFRRKQHSHSKLTTIISQTSATTVPSAAAPHKFSVESSVSDSPSLPPPPSRSAIFSSYTDSHITLSTRSLPDDVPSLLSYQRNLSQNYESMSDPDSHSTSVAAPESKQSSKGGLFSWARPRARTKSKASVPDHNSAPVLTLPPTDSFNLKSFRHITCPAPETPSSSSSSNKALFHPHAREGSFASDSSQRISVAAFREAQARRGATDSPVPSLPGDRDSFASSQVWNRRRSSALSTPPSVHTVASQSRISVPRNPPTRTSTLALSSAASDTSESSEEESESEEDATLRPNRQRTVSTRPAQSELGYRSSPIPSYSAARSDIGHGLSSGLHSRLPSSTPIARNSPKPVVSGSRSRNSSVYSLKRASASTPAVTPETSTKSVPVTPKYTVSRSTQPLQRSRSRASTSSESSSYSSTSEDAPLASLIPPQRPGSAGSRASGSPARRPAKPLIDIGELVGENSAPPPRTSEPLDDPPQPAVAQVDSPPARLRKASLGIGERLSALTSGFGGLQSSRSKSPEPMSDGKDEAFTPPDVPDEPRHTQPPVLSPQSSPILPTKPASPPLKSKTSKSLAMRLKSSSTPKLDTSSLKRDSDIPAPPSSSTSSDAPIPPITPTPIRERREPPAFTVTSRPISHASSQSIGRLTAVDKPTAETNYDPGQRRSGTGIADQPKQDQQPQRRPPQPQPQEEPQTTVRVVRSVPLKSSKEEPLPVPRAHSRHRVPSVGVTVSNVHLTPPSSSSPTSFSAPRQAPGSGAVAPPRRPFALRDRSPASSAGDSSSSRMPVTPKDGSELGVGPTGRPGVAHRKRVSVTFVDEINHEREARERDPRRTIAGNRSNHGHRPAVAADSSDDEDTARDREREAEEKRKERRRSEAKAAIELGNVINGTGPIVDDDDDDDDDDEEGQPMNVPPRMSMGMGMGMGMNQGHNIPFPTAVGPMGLQGQWGASAAAPFGNPLGDMSMPNLLNAGAGHGFAGGMNPAAGMNMGPGMVDPRALLAHQQAMMIAKQTYQLAIAQQAMRDAAEEWERGSAIGGWSSGRSSVGTPSMLGMGMGLNMNAGGGGSMGGFPGSSFPVLGSGGMWSGGAMHGFPGNAARTMFSGNPYAASEIGAAAGSDRSGPAGWTTSSVYGESFGAPRDRSSRPYRQSQMHQVTMANGGGGPTAQANKREGPRPRTKTAPSGASGGQRAGSAGVKRRGEGGTGLVGTVSPPTSWKGPL